MHVQDAQWYLVLLIYFQRFEKKFEIFTKSFPGAHLCENGHHSVLPISYIICTAAAVWNVNVFTLFLFRILFFSSRGFKNYIRRINTWTHPFSPSPSWSTRQQYSADAYLLTVTAIRSPTILCKLVDEEKFCASLGKLHEHHPRIWIPGFFFLPSRISCMPKRRKRFLGRGSTLPRSRSDKNEITKNGPLWFSWFIFFIFNTNLHKICIRNTCFAKRP